MKHPTSNFSCRISGIYFGNFWNVLRILQPSNGKASRHCDYGLVFREWTLSLIYPSKPSGALLLTDGSISTLCWVWVFCLDRLRHCACGRWVTEWFESASFIWKAFYYLNHPEIPFLISLSKHQLPGTLLYFETTHSSYVFWDYLKWLHFISILIFLDIFEVLINYKDYLRNLNCTSLVASLFVLCCHLMQNITLQRVDMMTQSDLGPS